MRRSPLLVIFATVFLDLLGFGIIIPILPYIAERFGASPLTVTALMASYSLMQVIFAPIWGKLSDRVGRRPIILMSLGVSTLGFLLLGIADSLALIFAARLLAGIGNANISTAQAYIADVTAPEERARGMGLLGMAFGLGFVFGPAMGGYLGGIAIALPAFVAAGLTAADLLLALAVLAEPPRHRTGEQAGSRRHPLSIHELREAGRRPGVSRLLLLFFATTFAFALLESTFALFVEHRWHGDSGTVAVLAASADATRATTRDIAHRAAARETGALLFAIGMVAAVVQGGLIGRLTRRYGERRLVVVGLALEAVGFALIPEAQRLLLLYPIGALIAVGNGIMLPSLQSLLSQSAAAGEQGSTMGLGQSLSSLARVCGPLLAGTLFQFAGLGSPYWIGALVLAGTALIGLGISTLPQAAGAPAAVTAAGARPRPGAS